MPKKFKSCVKKVSKKNLELSKIKQVNPYAICRVSTGFYGSTKEKIKKMKGGKKK